MTAEAVQPGAVLGPLEIGPPAHGGHCVARAGDLVVFVRHSLPGELVTVRITETRRRYCRGEVVEVLRAHPSRRTAPCPVADRCGGCDFQHATPGLGRELKAAVVAGLLQRAGIGHAPVVEAVRPDEEGWRTRMRYHADAEGRPGLRAHRSHEVVPLPPQGCLIATPAIARPPRASEDQLGVDADSEALIAAPGDLPATVRERVGGREFEVASDGFWQAHCAAPEVLTAAVLEALTPRAGERAFDLYCGVGVFAAALHDAGCLVWGVEGDRTAVRLARRNLPGVRFSAGDVAAVLDGLPARTDLVVLDPPRSGAGRTVMEKALARAPRAVAYVACDPAALARDLATAATLGYRTESVRAFDLFPLTHHVECVALLRPCAGLPSEQPATGQARAATVEA